MSEKPAARLSDPTACPIPGHGSNPITTGSPDVFIDGLPAARKGDTTNCGGQLVVGLSSTVFINGLNAAVTGSVGSHGNVVIGGSGTVIIGDVTPVPPVDVATAPFKGRFRLYDRDTGNPLAGKAVRVCSSAGHDRIERSDAEGFTAWVCTDKPETLALYAVEDSHHEQ